MSFDLVMLPPQDEVTRHWARRLREDVPDARVVVAETPDEAMAALGGGAEAAYGTLPASLLRHAPNLQWLQAPHAGPPAGFYYPELVEHEVVVTNLRGTYTVKVAAHAVALVLALARSLHRYVRHQVEHRWLQLEDPESVIHLPEATVLIVGMGNLGAEIAKMLAPFGCTMIGTDARLDQPAPEVDEVGPPSALDEFLPRADIIVVTVPHTPETEGLFNAQRFALMKPTAALVNVGRGPVVDIDALADALEAGNLRGAALDVFPIEPLNPDHRLWDLPQMIITPHAATIGPHTDEWRYAVVRENAGRFAAGAELINKVDKAHWF